MMRRLSLLLCLLASCLAVSSSNVHFYESFDEELDGRWISSSNLAYEGIFTRAKANHSDDFGLLVPEKAKKYAIAAELPTKVELLKDHPVVLQYDVRMQQGLDCGGAYLKFLMPQEAGWMPKDLKDDSPYSIMFGPDKCGGTNKVHFIYRHLNPKTGKYVEHHLKAAPLMPYDKTSHVYTAILEPSGKVTLLEDGEERVTANLSSESDFEPPLVPSKTIPDASDKKLTDWDDKEKIPDPDAKKPDDWDEDAPLMVEDTEAKKPTGWLDDEPLEIDDPEAVKPSDWSEEEDGEWEPPKVSNPRCQNAPGCGDWKPPKKRNPAYKGKWVKPLIDNPHYMGIWKPREIPNPEFFELEKLELEPIAAIGIEIWTMNDGIIFDNILISSDPTVAAEHRDAKWKPKHEVEKKAEEAEKKKTESARKATNKGSFKDRIFERLYQLADSNLFLSFKPQITDALTKLEDHPTAIYGLLIGLVLFLFAVIYMILPSPSRAPQDPHAVRPTPKRFGFLHWHKKDGVVDSKKDDVTSPDDVPTEDKDGSGPSEAKDDKVVDKDEDSGNVKRRVRRET